MKKHIIGVIIALVAIILSGVLLWLFVFKKDNSDLYDACSNYIHGNDTEQLQTSLSEANRLYITKSDTSGEKRLTQLASIVAQLDMYEQDLTAYLTFDTTKSSKLSKSYKSLTGSREYLLEQLNTYIIRMSGNTLASDNSMTSLYESIVNDTVDFTKEYNNCFNSTISYVFSKVHTTSNIKREIYLLYSANLSNLFDTMQWTTFQTMSAMEKLNSLLTLENGNIKFTSEIIGGEFSTEAVLFKKYFGSSSLSSIASNFITYYNETGSGFDVSTETNAEKLTVYYLLKLVGR